MDTKIITIANQKGGSGKTTICMQLAGVLGRGGFKVLIADADSQGTASRWFSNADENKPFPASIARLGSAGKNVGVKVKKYLGMFDYIFIDCPPAWDSEIPFSALSASHIALVPVIPSPADLYAVQGIQELITRVQKTHKKLKAYIVPNMYNYTNVNSMAIESLSEFVMPITKSFLGDRVAYKESMLIGGTVYDIKGESAQKAQEEIERLKAELNQILSIPVPTKA